ncbi:MAG: hypothetical protein EBU52_01065 [Cytophagia bacterium]|nr:hypothetical protein [Cytophagia bacterium]
MGLGWGFLKQMNDTIKYNRDILGKKRSVRDIYKDEILNRDTTYNKEALNSVRERVSIALKRNRKKEFLSRVVTLTILLLIVLGLIWVFVKPDIKEERKGKYDDKSKLYNTVMYDISGTVKLKRDYFIRGSKAADTYLKDGRKHQNSESYYESGEQFRSALYFYDTLLTDIYFYKTGDTISNFPVLDNNKVHRLKLLNKTRTKEIEFDFFDGKIIQGTYQEKSVSN